MDFNSAAVYTSVLRIDKSWAVLEADPFDLILRHIHLQEYYIWEFWDPTNS